MEFSDRPLEIEIQELADQVREHYPLHPELAFRYFCLSYPDIVSATMVSLVWSYIEVEHMMDAGVKYTRPLEVQDIQLFKSPFINN